MKCIRKVPDAGKNRGQEKRVSEDEMVGWHHRCNGHELGQTSGDGEGQRPGMLQSMRSQRVGHSWVTEHHNGCLPLLRDLSHTVTSSL